MLQDRSRKKKTARIIAGDRNAALFLQVRDSVNAMLLNEFRKAHWRIEEQDATLAKQQKQIDLLTRGLQKGERAA